MSKMIAIDSVSFCNIDNQIALSGEVSFNENSVVKIFPRSSGQVLETKVSFGDPVSKGQVLAVIRSADVAGDYSDLKSADADLAIAKRQMENAQSLYKNGISSEREYVEAKENYQKALATKNKVVSMININGGNHTNASGQYVLTAPIDGYVVEKNVNAGDFIRSDNGNNLFTISDLKTVWVYANVYEADIPKVKEGYHVTITPMAYQDVFLNGKVDKLSQVLDPQTKTLRVRITLDNKNMLLKPEMFVKVNVENMEGVKSICVPPSAILTQDGKSYVVIYNNDSDMRVAEVDVNKTVNNKTFINSGVQPGQHIITKNQLLIFNQLMNE
jgi:cobalt-zinc-cadmium efflux system membrane fusion protein